MKKNYLFLLLSMLSLFFIQCDHHDDNNQIILPPAAGTLFVDGQNFTLGSNANGEILNTSHSENGLGGHQVTFTITKSEGDQTGTHVIMLSVNYEDPQPSINGIYSFFNEGDPETDHYAVGSYSDMSTGNTYGDGHVAGTVKVTKNAENNYKIEFNNVKMYKNGSATEAKTITGFCQLDFFPF